MRAALPGLSLELDHLTSWFDQLFHCRFQDVLLIATLRYRTGLWLKCRVEKSKVNHRILTKDWK